MKTNIAVVSIIAFAVVPFTHSAVAGTSSKSAAPIAVATALPLPGGEVGIGFDDLMFSSAMNRVLAPGGRTGKLNVIDPSTLKMQSMAGFSSEATFEGGHGKGTTSADSNETLIFASDRGTAEMKIIDAATMKIVQAVKLAASPDYVRWVPSTKEIWVTEPRTKRIEIFGFQKKRWVKTGSIDVAGGPESLVIDTVRGRAFTHTWEDKTVVIDIAAHKEIARWSNGCKGSRGIALDSARGFLFVGCEEGKAIVLDATHDGKLLSELATGPGVDIISYNAKLGHLYVPSGDDAKLAIINVAPTGALSSLTSLPTAKDASCVVADSASGVYVCDPTHGQLLVFKDEYAAKK
jgi:hypothetical protein